MAEENKKEEGQEAEAPKKKEKFNLKEWIRKGGLFLIFSYVVTFIKWMLLLFLPAAFRALVGDTEWLWPNIPVTMFGVKFNISILGNALEYAKDAAGNLTNEVTGGGLAFTLANLTTIFIGEFINFPLQRNVTFKSKGPIGLQAAWHMLATVAVFLVMNLFTSIWNPVTNALITNVALRDTISSLVTTIVTGGVAMVIIFFVDNKIFAPGFGQKGEKKDEEPAKEEEKAE